LSPEEPYKSSQLKRVAEAFNENAVRPGDQFVEFCPIKTKGKEDHLSQADETSYDTEDYEEPDLYEAIFSIL
jgi:hypothetical protein